MVWISFRRSNNEWLEERRLKSYINFMYINNSHTLPAKPLSAIAEEIVRIVCAAERSLPAHYTSSEDRSQTFCADFQELNETDEYDLASATWYDFSSNFGNEEDEQKNLEQAAILRIGEDVALASYMAHKRRCEKELNVMRERIIATNIEDFEGRIQFMENSLIKQPLAQNYWNQCVQVGVGIATEITTE